MARLEIEIPDLVFSRLTALSLARKDTVGHIAAQALGVFAADGKTRREIRKARRKGGDPSLEDLGWLNGYLGQSMDELMSYEGSEAPIFLLMAIEEAILPRFKDGGLHWTGVERTLLSVMALFAEVNNGGFDQFFRNSSLRFGPAIVDDLNRIGARDTAAIARKAVAALRLKELTPDNIRSRMDVADEERKEILHECNEAFYRLNEVPACLFAYVRDNQGGIRL